MPPRRSIQLYPKTVWDLIEEAAPRENDACVLPREDWERWTNRQTTEVLLVRVKQGPVENVFVADRYHTEDESSVYLPNRWIHDYDPFEECAVEVLNKMPPIATKISLEPLDSEAAAGFDVAASVSAYLSHWTVLKVGTILTVPCQEIEDYTIDVLVKALEPEPLVLLRGEVPLDLTLVQQEPSIPQNTLVPIQTSSNLESKEEEEDFDAPMVCPVAVSAAVPGAFQGKGYRLGS
jgi:hypothetical protein